MSHEFELFKDKIEVSLEGRQIFYLFFGGAVIVALVFVLGVMVGKRVEARAYAANLPDAEQARDPLAALDKLGEDDLRFSAALSGAAGSPLGPLGPLDERVFGDAAEDGDRDAAEHDDARAEALARARVRAQAKAKAEAEKQAKAKAKAKAEKQAEAKAEAEKQAKAEAEAEKQAKAEAEKRARAEAEKRAKAKAEAAAAADDATDDATAETAEADDQEASSRGSRFTLQLSSFRDRAEADSFYDRLTAAGYSPYIIEADVEDKGTWYRVRLGGYATFEQALAAKKKFEDSQGIIAYVTRMPGKKG